MRGAFRMGCGRIRAGSRLNMISISNKWTKWRRPSRPRLTRSRRMLSWRYKTLSSLLLNQLVLQVSHALENELAKIDNLIADFAPGDGFHPTKTDEYRRQLIKHVETGFKRNLVSYCSESLVSNVCKEKRAMIQQLTNVVDDRVEVSDGFELDYDVDFIALNDFKEDITFKFWADPRRWVSFKLKQNEIKV